jgi:ABC-2 type transport system permease protein
MDVKKVVLVARWEFISAVTRRMYVFAVVAMPVIYGLMLTAAGVTGTTVARSESRRPVGVVDRAHVIDFAVAREAAEAARTANRDDPLPASAPPMAPAPLAEYADLDHALADLRAHTVSGVFVVEGDYLSTGRITAFGNDTGLLSLPAARRRQAQVGDAIRATLLHRALSGDALARAYAPAANVTRMHVDGQGAVSPDVASAGGPFAGSFGVFFVLTMAIFFSAGFLQQATVEDRQNRMIEILLSSLDTDELLVGKMLGLGGAGLLQVAIYLVLLIVPGILVLALIQVSIAKLVLSVVYFVIGYTLFASLMAGTGMLGRTAQESAQLSAIWTLTAASPMFFLAAISASPNGMLARALSLFPLTGPVTMMMRLGGGDVPAVDVIATIAIGIVTIYFTLRAASKILRAASLMYGKRPTLPELVRWLRAA